MIKSNELRIGNLVLFHGEIDTVCGLGIGNGYCRNNGYFNDDKDYIKPVRLTTEWLERFGFAESNSYSKKERHFKKDGFNQFADYGSQIIVLPEGGFASLSCGYYENEIDCPYIHTLQNLFFALTGEELTIKETA